MIGIVLEYIVTNFYKKIDAKEESNLKLVVVVLLQLTLLIGILEHFDKNFYLRMGLLPSQVFVFNYAYKRLDPFTFKNN